MSSYNLSVMAGYLSRYHFQEFFSCMDDNLKLEKIINIHILHLLNAIEMGSKSDLNPHQRMPAREMFPESAGFQNSDIGCIQAEIGAVFVRVA